MLPFALPHSVSHFFHLHDDTPAPEKARRKAGDLLDAFQMTGAALGKALNRLPRGRAPDLPDLLPPRGRIGLVIQAEAGHGVRLVRPHVDTARSAPLVRVGLIHGTMDPAQLHDVLKLIRETKRRGEEVLIRAPFDAWLQETLAIAGRLLDKAVAGQLGVDPETSLPDVCVEIAPHASLSDMHLAGLCAFHQYCYYLHPKNWHVEEAPPRSLPRTAAARGTGGAPRRPHA